ncbi:peroxiredoxin [Kiloniella laminariae]|uniref:Glutathione-dependent peroxiredoxin n=1 Tax=Kiloniella laminariae TaxID=454162 RepID=A0ABT4LN82_9PROT|nr:peroxiredoxin [Kiloniella laminariae]MCZ4281791.1 peroxiredoxin [Kiloniella laminariae]
MTITVGAKVPSATIWNKDAEGMNKIDFAEFCSGKTIALFAVPGAFTPTCQDNHFPSFKKYVQSFKDKGVDIIACLSVNDAFVMRAWGQKLDAEGDILMLADGNGDLAKALGLTLDGTGFGLGLRSARFSMLIKDGTVTALNVDDAGSYEVSDADTLLKAL